MLSGAALVAALAITAGCGAAGENASQTSGAAANGQSVQDAKAFVQKWSSTPTTIGIQDTLTKKPEPAKRIAHIRCPIEGCEAIYTGLSEASSALGWQVQPFNMDNTPEGVNQAFQAALAAKPDGIVISGIPEQVYKQNLDAAKAAGIPVVSLSV
jgi:ribose transport system substrate-binding protein